MLKERGVHEGNLMCARGRIYGSDNLTCKAPVSIVVCSVLIMIRVDLPIMVNRCS